MTAGVAIQVRELRTRSATPSAPPLETLLARDGELPQQFIVLWEPAHNWPHFSTLQLTSGAHPKVAEVRLRQEQVDTPLAIIQHTILPTPDGQDIGVVWVKAACSDPLAAHVALTLLEQADRAVVMAGGSNDKEVVRQLTQYQRSHGWDGPSLLLLSPADKPSRAERLRKSTWPKGLRIHVLELFASQDPDWSLQLVSMVSGNMSAGDAATAPKNGSSPDPRPVPARTSANMPNTDDPSALPTTVVSDLIEPAVAAACLDLVSSAPGVLACAVVDYTRHHVIAAQGDPQRLNLAVADLIALWRAYEGRGSNEPLRELSIGLPGQHLIALPVDHHPGALLMAVCSSEFGDMAMVRWQLTVARNHLS